MTPRIVPADPIEDSQRLMNELLPMAKMLLERYGEFFPMGAEIGAEGELQQVAAPEGIDQTNTLALAELLRQTFIIRAEQGELRASAIIQDLMVLESSAERRADAVSIEIEHFTGYNVTIIVHYKRVADRITFGAPFVTEGVYRIFPRRQG
jgi:hypothetical protein